MIRILEGLAESYGNKNIFLGNLIHIKTRDKKPLLERLLFRVDGGNNRKMISFLWKIWFASGYKELDPEHNKLISITENSPVILD